MRCALASALLLMVAACSEPAPVVPKRAEVQSFTGAGRDRLCIAKQGGEQRAGLIVYGSGNANCSLSGALAKGSGSEWLLTPRGEGACKVGLHLVGDGAITAAEIAAVPAACSYYCGSGAALTGKAFRSDRVASKVSDLAGDPLC